MTAFLLTAPHSAWVSLTPVLLVLALLLLDRVSPPDRSVIAEDSPSWPFDLIALGLAAIQLANVILLARAMTRPDLSGLDTFMMMLGVGVSSGYSGIVVAHELIHRPSRPMKLLGRLLLSTVLYEHFFTEHLRGHHARVGTPEDPATARFGENYRWFFIRTVPAQFRSAWRLETSRLGDADMKPWDPRLLSSRVVHGLVLGWGLALAIFIVFGATALAAHLLQAFVAIRLLEAVNYFEHWGLVRTDKRVRPVDSWDAESWLTRNSLVGLSRHADHHAHASRPYHLLRVFPESPKLPTGYYGMVLMSIFHSSRVVRLLSHELQQQGRIPEGSSASVPELRSASAA